MDRYKVERRGLCTYAVFDNIRGCAIMKSISPNASYNEEVATSIVNLLNIHESAVSKIVKLNKED